MGQFLFSDNYLRRKHKFSPSGFDQNSVLLFFLSPDLCGHSPRCTQIIMKFLEGILVTCSCNTKIVIIFFEVLMDIYPYHNILGRPSAYLSEDRSRAGTLSVKGRYSNHISERKKFGQTFHPYLSQSLLLSQCNSIVSSICLR